jgi:hypothetical protein
LQLLLKPRNVLKALIPAPFEFTSNKSIFWIDRIILPSGAVGLILRMLQHELGLAKQRGAFLLTIVNSFERCVQSQRRQQP